VPGHPPLHLVAIDMFQALRVQPALLGGRFDNVLDLLQNDAIMLSQSAADELDVAKGGDVLVQIGTRTIALRVVAVLPADANAQRIAFADIATAQWRAERLGCSRGSISASRGMRTRRTSPKKSRHCC